LRHYETAFYDAPLSDNNSFEQWRDSGSQPSEQRATALWKQTLANYEAPPIDDAVDAELREFVSRRKAEMPDQWY
jgi:trimethylamine--corrinoid protein Co-methyltransferase